MNLLQVMSEACPTRQPGAGSQEEAARRHIKHSRHSKHSKHIKHSNHNKQASGWSASGERRRGQCTDQQLNVQTSGRCVALVPRWLLRKSGAR